MFRTVNRFYSIDALFTWWAKPGLSMGSPILGLHVGPKAAHRLLMNESIDEIFFEKFFIEKGHYS